MARLGESGRGGSQPGYPVEGYTEAATFDEQNKYAGTRPAWRVYGTSLDTYEQHGLSTDVLDCPSGDFFDGPHNIHDEGVWVGDYVLAMGTTRPKDRLNNGEYPCIDNPDIPAPGVSLADDTPGGRILAADNVVFPPLFWGDYPHLVRINHIEDTTGDPYAYMPAYQNRLMNDGHVDALTEADYRNPLEESGASLRGFNVYVYYWHGS